MTGMTNSESALEADRDIILIDALKQGRDAAFESLFSRYKDRIYSLVSRTVGEHDADDVVQEAFLGIYQSIPRFRGDSSFRTWAYRITLNVCSDHIRKCKRRPEELTGDPPEPSPANDDPELKAVNHWTQYTLENAVEHLPEIYRSVIELHYVQGMTYTEIAQVLECPTGTVKARVHTALCQLRRRLMPFQEEMSEL
jgi:RNA polymerase sigma-70 factor, ECF subfamily